MKLDHLEIYIVGGYVRDRLLGRETKDHDFVVVGSSTTEMLALGFSQVGADFPVFLHPQSGDEFALARTERKVAAGYSGFQVDFDPSITLEQDLFRRDLTINSLARKVIGWNDKGHAKLDDTVIDFFGGIQDLKDGILRPVSQHFKEDPVRVLRAGRFAARYNFDFSVELIAQCIELTNAKELDSLVAERVWQELEKTLHEPHPSRFFQLLDRCGGTHRVFPFLRGNVDPTLMDLCPLPNARLILLTHKMLLDDCQDFLEHLKAPTHITRMCINTIRAQNIGVFLPQLDANALLQVIDTFDFHRAGLSDLIDILEALHHIKNPRLDPVLIKRAVDCIKTVNFSCLPAEQQKTLKGPDIRSAIRQLQLEKLQLLI